MEQLITGAVADPHALLGAHPDGDGTVLRTLRRGASQVSAVVDGVRHRMRRRDSEGIFEVTVPATVTDYRVEVDGTLHDDPYRYPPELGELDLHLIAEGRHERLWEALGARPRPGGGVRFTLWAPNARGVRVVGDFTGWGPHEGWPMRSLGGSGVWELVVPDAAAGDRYKFRILAPDGQWREKADPMAFSRRRRPRWSRRPTPTPGRTRTGSTGAQRGSRTRSR